MVDGHSKKGIEYQNQVSKTVLITILSNSHQNVKPNIVRFVPSHDGENNEITMRSCCAWDNFNEASDSKDKNKELLDKR